MPLLRLSFVLTTLLVAMLVGNAPVAVATSGLDAHATATTVRTQGISLLSANLLVLLQESRDEPGSPPQFHLTAPSVVVETTMRDPTAHVEGFTAGLDAESRTAEYHAVAITGQKARLDDRLDVFALPHKELPHLHAETGCSTWTAPDRDVVDRDPRIPSRSSRTVSVHANDGARVSNCDGLAHWTVTGDFVVLVWERDAQLQSAEGRESLRSGQLVLGSPTRDDQDGAMQPVSRDQEIYLYVTGGTLEIPMNPATVAYVTPEATLSGANGLQLRQATFQVGNEGMPVESGDLRLFGSFEAKFGALGKQLGVQLGGTLISGTADGQAFGGRSAPATPVVQEAAGMGVVGITLACAVVLVAVTLFALRARRRAGKALPKE